MGKIINIDNGGTLTDFCAFDGEKVFHTKSLTTPFDLSKCFFDGLRKLANSIYGDETRVDELLQSTDYIRYSTTQGTNALVERKGPRLGLLVAKGADTADLTKTDAEASLFEDLIEDRVGEVDLSLSGEQRELAIISAVNRVASLGASRIILSVSDSDFMTVETDICRTIGRKFPSHLLGVVPVLSAGELSDDPQYKRRTWSALFNAFLHPAMERFLYSADHRLKEHKTRNPLLIFRNDGGAARVAKTMAIKSYSSGPRGGMEGVKALSDHYGYGKLLSYDVGGTTTDIGLVNDGVLATAHHGKVQGVDVSFPLADINSAGVGGSSIIGVESGSIFAGPESVGAAPGPACFGLGGRQATITDVYLLLGVLDPTTYFGGELNLDADRAKEAVVSNVAEPLGIGLDEALEKMLAAWVGKIAASLKSYSPVDDDTTLAGFGGAGALAATRIADACGAKRVIIPSLGAVFSAAGIGFSPISQVYRVSLDDTSKKGVDELINSTAARAEKDLFAEGIELSECEVSVSVLKTRAGEVEAEFELEAGIDLSSEFGSEDAALLVYEARKAISGLKFADVGKETPCEPVISGTRTIRFSNNEVREVPVIALEDQSPGAQVSGPVVIEEAFFTGLVDEGWQMSVSGNRDLILEKIT